MATKQYLDMPGLQKYDGLIKAKITTDVNAAKDAVETKIGTLTDLTTTAKGDLVSAVNEVKASVKTNGDAAKVTISAETTTDGMAKSYTVKQGTATVGVIDIPKDMVVSSGQVVVNPTGEEHGTYIELTLANATADKIYVNVGKLVDIYTAQASATQIQLTINPTTREISAAIVAGSVGTTELADEAVTTVKLADGNVTKAKLATDVQTSLGKADSAIQEVATGKTNGSVSVDGTDVPVKGLGTAAYTGSDAYATAAQGEKADSAVQSVAAGTADGTIAVDGADVSIPGYSNLASDVANLKGTTYTPITDAEIEALFPTI